jgi:hypothetical protein
VSDRFRRRHVRPAKRSSLDPKWLDVDDIEIYIDRKLARLSMKLLTLDTQMFDSQNIEVKSGTKEFTVYQDSFVKRRLADYTQGQEALDLAHQ